MSKREMTDPARELAELCQCLQVHTPELGEVFLSEQFEVTAWSKEFYQILFAILDRVELVKLLIANLELDEDVKDEALAHATKLSNAFNSSALQNAWLNYGEKQVSARDVQPIKMLSTMVRQRMSYPKLSGQDIKELESEIAELLGWLREHQLAEQDFIRQALVEGLSQLLFRISKLKWLGYGYAIASLRDVISAYMALERSVGDPVDRPDAAAMMQKVGGVIRSIYDRVSVVKDVVETGDFMLRAYGAVSLVVSHYPGIAGLLSHG